MCRLPVPWLLPAIAGRSLRVNGAVDMDRLFGDQLVTATELNRRVGAILNMAMEQPVTIIRNNQYCVR